MPTGLLFLAKLIGHRGRRPTIAKLAADLSLSSSQTAREGGRPLLKPVEEFLIHGVKHAFPAQRGEPTSGIPTAYAAPPLNAQISASSNLPPVWPAPEGEVRGTSLEPLHRMVPVAVLKDPVLYELLALIDALRNGRVRERRMAERELASRL